MTPSAFLADNPCPCEIDGYLKGMTLWAHDGADAPDSASHRPALIEARAARMKASQPCGGDECNYKRKKTGKSRGRDKFEWVPVIR